jgi:hypothetical protein
MLDKCVDPLSSAGRVKHRPHRTDDFKSIMHRASDKNVVDRYFIVMFFGTDYEVNIEVRLSDIVALAAPDADAVHYSQSTPVK